MECTCVIDEPEVQALEVHEIRTTKVGTYPVAKGEWKALPHTIQKFVAHWVSRAIDKGISFVNPFALGTTKTLWSSGRSECNRVKS